MQTPLQGGNFIWWLQASDEEDRSDPGTPRSGNPRCSETTRFSIQHTTAKAGAIETGYFRLTSTPIDPPARTMS